MTRLPERFIEDRALRDAARAVLTDDIERLRSALEEEGIASRVSSGVTSTISSRIRTGAQDFLAEMRAQAGDHRGIIALLAGAIILWFARGPILDWFAGLIEDMDADENPGEDHATDEPATPAAPAPAAAPAGDPA